jgi:phosphate-selective porin OprO/OprP
MTNLRKTQWLAGVSASMILLVGPALAETPRDAAAKDAASSADIGKKLQQLEQQIQDLKASQASELAETQRAVKASQQSGVSFNNGRPTFTSADGNFSAALRSLVQLDGAYYSQSEGSTTIDLSSGENFRRARIGFSGTFYKVWDYYFLYDFGGSNGVEGSTITQAYVQYSGFGKPLAIRVGAFPPYANLEDSEGAGDGLFLERNSGAEITRNIAGGDGRTAIALYSQGDHYLASVAVTGGKVGDAATFDEQEGLVGRLAFVPLNTKDAKIVVGVNGTDVFDTADASVGSAGAAQTFTFQNQPELKVDSTGTRLVSAALADPTRLYHWGVDAGGNWKNFYAEGGYYGFGGHRGALAGAGAARTDPDFSAWYVAGSWIFTGEAKKWDAGSASFRSPSVTHPVDGKGGWGAWELAARYSDVDLNWNAGVPGAATPAGGIRGGEQKIVTAGLNWYPNNVLRFLFDYQHDEINRLNAAGLKIQPDTVDALSARVQVAF